MRFFHRNRTPAWLKLVIVTGSLLGMITAFVFSERSVGMFRSLITFDWMFSSALKIYKLVKE